MAFRSVLFAAVAAGLLGSLGCAAVGAPEDDGDRFGEKGAAAVASIYTEDGWMSLEDDYVPRVCTQENGGADFEALKAQAVAARTYLLRAMRDDPALGTASKPVGNGEYFQAYAKAANDGCIEATKATRGVVARWGGELTIANYVAGALVNEDGSLGKDYSLTEKWVTYNEGKTGSEVTPTKLSLTSRSDNRGCMSQNRADWLSEHGQDYAAILRYFYGADLELSDPAGDQPDPGNKGCGDLTYEGRCDGALLSWCEDNAVKSVDCASNGKTCGFQDDAVGYNCVEEVPVASECDKLGYTGACDGQTVVWCESGEVKKFDCAGAGMVCGYQDDVIGYNCL